MLCCFPILLARPLSRPPQRFFRLVCDEYFCTGSFPPADPTAGGQEVRATPNGTAGESAGVAGSGGGGDGGEDAAGSGGAAATAAAALRQSMLRADYVNSVNAFNQLPVRK